MRIQDPGLLSGDPALASPIFTDSVPNGSVSCVAQDYRNAKHLLVTFFNYGVPSVWESFDYGGTWKDVEGNLPDMPVRWCVFHPDDPNRALLATDLGVWSTDDLSGISTGGTVEWTPTNGGLANTRVDMIRLNWEDIGEYESYLSNDMFLAAATHGRGLFTTTLPRIPNVAFGAPSRYTPEFTTVKNDCERYTD